MDAFIEQQEKELHRKLVAKLDAEAAATGGPTYDEVMASWRDFREQMAILRTRRSPGSADTTSHG
jgi:hypothetical protein